MNTLILRTAALCLATCTPLFATPPLPAERLSVAALPPNNPHRVFVVDEAFENEIDARVDLFDGDTYRRLGQIDAGFNPGFNLSPDAKTSVVATTYFSRGSRGTRTDVVEFTDNSNLTTTHEIVLPSKRAMTLPTYFNIAYSADAHFVYVSYITPAASFGVLDPVKGTVLGEIDTAGCVLVIPSGPNRVSSICESGRLLTVTLDAHGHEASRSMSEPFFNPDQDPDLCARHTDGRWVRLPVLPRRGARSRLLRCPAGLRRAVVAGERSREGPLAPGRNASRRHPAQVGPTVRTHARGAAKAPTRTAAPRSGCSTSRLTSAWRAGPWNTQKLAPVIAVQVSQDDAPLLFAATNRSDVAVFDAHDRPLAPRRETAGTNPLAHAESLKGTSMRSIDDLFEKSSRSLAQRTSRRSLLATLGQILTGAALHSAAARRSLLARRGCGAGRRRRKRQGRATTIRRAATIGSTARSTASCARAAAAPRTPARRARRPRPSPGSAPATIRAMAATTSCRTTIAAEKRAAATANATATSARSRCTGRRATTI